VSSRIGTGPWARAVGTVLVPDDSTPEAMRGEELWRQGAVDLRIDVGQVTARVGECVVTLTAPTIPPRIWTAVTSYARNRRVLEQAVRGEAQSVQLEHLMAQDWDEPLVPLRAAIRGVCTCDAPADCAHLAAVAHVVAASIDADPAALLRWRGVGDASARDETQRDVVTEGTSRDDGWRGSALPAALPDARRQTESVPKRLGPAGIHVSDADLADVLATAYAALAQASS
jgi:uncharacterized Zn finger protein